MFYGTYCRLGVHVYASNRTVIRAAHKKLAPKGRSREQRSARHAFLREMLNYHHRAEQLVLDCRL